jgi:chemosensory pili system protein ChpB (putative protein-glutamate methylesterase)
VSANDPGLVADRAPLTAGKRVALLARPGPAREQLRLALNEAGAELVLEDDPNTLDAGVLAGLSPQVVLVALEAAIEDSLPRFDQVLHDPAVAVMYDEAELAARRDGWEAKRWARHLAAKLNGHADVLPPGGELDDTQPEPGLPPTPAQLHADAAIEPYLEEAQDIASELPRGGLEAADMPAASALSLALDDSDWQPRAPVATESVPVSALAVEPPPLPSFSGSGLVLELESLNAGTAAPGLASTPVVGAALLFAGIGGPDAVRKVLAELPENLSRPVLVQLRLDGGRYDNLVKQMERVSALPVLLAKAGDSAFAGHVYVLPNDVAIVVKEGVVHFGEGSLDLEGLIAALPAAESAVLLLSGSDPSQVDAALALAAQGGFVAGQSPQGCYDPAASKALLGRGGAVAAPAELAAQLALHWQG